MQDEPETRTITVEERDEMPLDGLVLGFGPMLPFPVAAVTLLLAPTDLAALALGLAIFWGAAILIFLAGVRRGLSFRTEGGPRTAQLAVMFWLFLLGLGALSVSPAFALALLLAGYGSLAVLDPIAARRAEAPLYFARLRPPQMAIAAVSIAVMLVAVLTA